MKKLLILALISAGAVSVMQSCKKDPDGSNTGNTALTVAEKQRSLLVYSTATWCGPCGLTGGPLFKSAIAARTTDQLISLDLHPQTSVGLSLLNSIALKPGKPDSLFFAPYATELYAVCKPNGYIPHFYCDNSVLGNSAVTLQQITDFADQYNQNKPEIGVAASATASGNDISIKYKMKAFAPEAGADYYTSVLVVEKSIQAYQYVGNTHSSVEHKNIVRGSAKTTASGRTFFNQSVWAGAPVAFGDNADWSNPTTATEVEKTASFKFESPSQASKTTLDAQLQAQIGYGFGWWNFNKSNTAVVVVVWKKISATEMYFVNAVWADVK